MCERFHPSAAGLELILTGVVGVKFLVYFLFIHTPDKFGRPAPTMENYTIRDRGWFVSYQLVTQVAHFSKFFT